MADMMPKIRAIRQRSSTLDIEVDGGINSETVRIAAAAGANVFVAGNAVFGAPDPASAVKALYDAAAEAFKG
jgi:ribulose-phosphate 3-epimerase